MEKRERKLVFLRVLRYSYLLYIHESQKARQLKENFRARCCFFSTQTTKALLFEEDRERRHHPVGGERHDDPGGHHAEEDGRDGIPFRQSAEGRDERARPRPRAGERHGNERIEPEADA